MLGFATVGVVGRMSKNDTKGAGLKPSERPVITPEVYSGEQSLEDWIDQFENIVAIKGWDEEQKLVWLKVRLMGRALLAYKTF